MEQLKKLGDILQQHYEKIVLGVVLIALLGAALYLPIRVSQNRQAIEEARDKTERVPRQQSQPVDTSRSEGLLKRSARPPVLDLGLGGEHRLFNPDLWKRTPNGDLLRIRTGEEEGPAGLALVETRPLYFRVAFEGVQASGDNVRYQFGVTDETAGGGRPRKTPRFLVVGQQVREVPFLLQKVNGDPRDPASVEIRLRESNEVVTITRDQPFARIAGHEADLRHDALGKSFKDVRARQNLTLGSEPYNVVAITKDALTLQSSKTQKRWTIRLKSSP
ncbi:MAG: hypothetical protein ACKVYV_18530 [Limisphaerales bacterium]